MHGTPGITPGAMHLFCPLCIFIIFFFHIDYENEKSNMGGTRNDERRICKNCN